MDRKRGGREDCFLSAVTCDCQSLAPAPSESFPDMNDLPNTPYLPDLPSESPDGCFSNFQDPPSPQTLPARIFPGRLFSNFSLRDVPGLPEHYILWFGRCHSSRISILPHLAGPPAGDTY